MTTSIARNEGMPLDASFIDHIRINTPAVERRVASLPKRRAVKGDSQTAWLINAIQCMDLTTLSGDDTSDRVRRLCAKARNPLRPDLLDALGLTDTPITTGAICVYHRYVATAVQALQGTDIPVAAVSTGFPAGLTDHKLKLAEIESSVQAGAKEIDIVITRSHVLNQDWQALYTEMKEYRQACGHAHVKAILATGDLKTLRNVSRASFVCMMAGADFIKTSTGKESVNATLPVSLVMARAIRDYDIMTGFKVGYKPAGGVSKAKDALNYQVLMMEELGRDWLSPHLFRFGASSLLTDLERQIEHRITGQYSTNHRHSIS